VLLIAAPGASSDPIPPPRRGSAGRFCRAPRACAAGRVHRRWGQVRPSAALSPLPKPHPARSK